MRLTLQVGLARESAGFLLAVACCAVTAATPDEPMESPGSGEECLALAAAAWPHNSLAQTARLQRLESAATRCNAEPRFLAALGGAWLEMGDAKQALRWLERALMLDASLEAAQADHSLALAALGEPVALQELLAAWAGRSDVPPALWRRLNLTARRQESEANGVAAMARKLLVPSNGWQQLAELQLLAGHETNLGQSPSLEELRITPPDGPVNLPLAEPLRAVSGNAATLDASWQAATSNAAQQSFLLGVQALGRSAPRENDTDWHSLRLAVSAAQAVGRWRWRLQARLHANGGPLSEPSRQSKWSMAAEGPIGLCSQRWAVETDNLSYRESALNDSRTTALAASVLCSAPRSGSWAFGISARRAEERANDPLRPGGNQTHTAAALRLLGDLSGSGSVRAWTLDAQWHYSIAKDEKGYSVLLEDNARRLTRTQILNVELAGPASVMPQFGARTVFQLQISRQKSNLALFNFDSASLYGGLRFKW